MLHTLPQYQRISKHTEESFQRQHIAEQVQHFAKTITDNKMQLLGKTFEELKISVCITFSNKRTKAMY